MGALWASSIVGLTITVAGCFVGQPWSTVLVGVGLFFLGGGVTSLLSQPFTREGAVSFDAGDGHGHGGGHGGGHH